MQRYLKCSKRGKAIPFPPALTQLPPPDTVPRGRSPYTPPPTHLWHMDKPLHATVQPLEVPPWSLAALQHVVSICVQRGPAACFELTAFLLLINISRYFHFCTPTCRLPFSLPPVHSHCCVRVQPQVGFPPGLTPRDQRSDVLQDLLFGCQT